MPGLGLGLSINARNAITAGSSAPSGIPVAGTELVVVTSSNEFIPSETYYLNGSRFEDFSGDNVLQFNDISAWNFISNFVVIATATGSADYIPFSGYTIVVGSGSITVAAA
jgi:hypothetical protein